MGVWVLRYESDRQLPKDFGRMSLAMNMEEKIQIMKEDGATLLKISRRWRNFVIAQVCRGDP